MQDPKDLIVISDLHLGPENGRGLFRADSQLADFLRWVLEEANPTRVVIAGDFLDFLVPGEEEETVPAFDPKGAAIRCSRIVERHPEVFDGLARLMSSPRNELWILSGNHDPELLFPDVRETLEQRLTNGSHSACLRWRVEGEAVSFRLGEATVLVAHGDLFDDWNRIDHASFRQAANRISFGFSSPRDHGYAPPIGTRLIVEYVLRLRVRYPWIDALKPEREAVFPILYEFLESSERPKFRSLLKYALGTLNESFVSEIARRYSPSRLVRTEREADLSPRRNFENWLAEEGTLVRNSIQAVPQNLISKLRRASAEDHFFELFAPDANARFIPFLSSLGTDLVILGHTHAAKACLLEKGLYLNSGTWAQLLQLPKTESPDEKWQAFLAALHAGHDLGQSRPTFLHLVLGRGGLGPLAKVMDWHEGAPSSQATFRFVTANRSWKKENP